MDDALQDWLAQRAFALPDAEAVVAGDVRLTFAELDARVCGLAGRLIREGVLPGDRVALLASNSLEFVDSVHAVPRAGAVLVPLNLRLTVDELAFQLEDAGVRLLLTDAHFEATGRTAVDRAGVGSVLVLPAEPSEATGLREVHGHDDTHSIVYTSGTTGKPKGAMLTFGNFWASATASAFNLGVVPGDRWLACMPLFHVGGLSIVLRSAIYGTACVIHEGFDERAVSNSLRNDGISLVSVVPTMLHRILEVDDGPAPALLRAVLVGGGPVPLPLLERAIECGYPVVQTYGLTEAASQVATLALRDAVAHSGSAGKPLLNVRLRIDAPGGQAGEILVAGPTVSSGYFGRPDATSATRESGWLRTGDVGRLDTEGFLYIVDRREDLIVSAGENVYPAEVEAALLAHVRVSAAAVVGIPDERWGQVVAAAIVAGGGLTDAELEDWLRAKLAGYKLPRRFIHLEELPMTANGKVLRRKVREMFNESSPQN